MDKVICIPEKWRRRQTHWWRKLHFEFHFLSLLRLSFIAFPSFHVLFEWSSMTLMTFERRRWSFEYVYRRDEVSKLIMEEIMFFEFHLQDKWNFELFGEYEILIENMKIWFRVCSISKEKNIVCYKNPIFCRNIILFEFSYRLGIKLQK